MANDGMYGFNSQGTRVPLHTLMSF